MSSDELMKWDEVQEEYFNSRLEPGDIPITEPVGLNKEGVMPNIDEIYPQPKSNHLKAEDLNGHEVKAEVSGYELVGFDDGQKIVLKFSGKDKTLVLNKTNAKAIGAAFSKDPDAWIGKEINIYPATTEYGGKTVPCLRVRPELPKAEDFPDDDIPF